jgi:hypothetical protein
LNKCREKSEPGLQRSADEEEWPKPGRGTADLFAMEKSMAKSIDLMEATGSWEHQSDLNDLLIVRKMEHPLLGQLISSEYDEYV